MTTHVRTTVPFGRLVAAVFAEAAHHGNSPREVSRLAVKAVAHLLECAPRSSHGSVLRVALPSEASTVLAMDRT